MIIPLNKTPCVPEAENDRQPHVLLVVDLLEKTLGGGERMVVKLASLLPLYGYRVSILAFSVDPESAAFESSNCPIYLLPLDSTYNLNAVRAAFDLRRFLREQRVQIVQTFFESSDLWAGFVTKTMSKAKLIWSRRDMGILRTGKHHMAYRLMAGVPDVVFAVSEQVRRHCIEVDRIDAARIHTIYNGLNLADWDTGSSPHKSSDKFVITTAGNIRRVKGHDLFIKAAASVRRQFPEASFSIAGIILDPVYFAELQALVDDLDLNGHFHFAGGLTDLRKHLATADVFVLPSRSEGFSNAIVEAMAASLPVVATNVGGNAEAVQDGVNGFIVPPEDSEALAAAIIHLLEDPAQAKKMGSAGKGLALEKFTVEAMMNQIVGAYGNLLDGKPSSR
jgi:glycosyltransferase involved in cell wall biosynthesis